MNTLDKDQSLKTCASSLNNITSAFAPGGNATTSPSQSQVQSTLNNLCSASTSNSCPESLMRQRLTQFYASCPTEITTNPAVKLPYDVLYALYPLWTALCAKDDNGGYCATQLPASNGLKNAISTGGSSALSNLINSLAEKAPTGAGIVPNITTYQNTNIPFLFLQPSSDSQAALPSNSDCTTCTRNILTAYVNALSTIPYGPGLAASLLLAGQPKLYSAVTNTCGANFLSGVVQAAGGLSGGTLSSGAMQNVVTLSQEFAAVGMGILAIMVSSIF
jgi:hypothetical protein